MQAVGGVARAILRLGLFSKQLVLVQNTDLEDLGILLLETLQGPHLSGTLGCFP